MAEIRGLLFDKDGTLFDFHSTWGGWTARVIERLAGPSAETRRAVAEVLGFDLEARRFDEGSVVIGHTVAEIAALLAGFAPDRSVEALVSDLNALAVKNDMVPAVPLVPLFRRLREMGLKLGLATNDAEEPARVHLENSGLTSYFDFVAGFDSGWGGKPATGQMRAFLDRTGLEAHETAMVGDSLHDLHAGRAAGMKTVAVLTGIAGRDELAPHADIVLPTIGDLPGWIGSVTAA